MPPRTIDNLGVDISTRYAKDQKEFDASLVKEAGRVSTQTQIDVSIPSYTSEWEAIFGMGERKVTWADFFAPPKYAEQKKRLFTHHIMPGMAEENKKEALLLRISTYELPAEKEDKDKEKKENEMAWEEEREKEEEEKEKKTLLALLNTIGLLDKLLVDVNARRGQYQRG